MEKTFEDNMLLGQSKNLESMEIEEDCGKYSVKILTYDFVSFDRILTNTAHQHNFYEVCMILSGSGLYRHGDEQYKVSTGNLILAEPNSMHELSCYDSKNLEIVFFIFTIDVADIPLSNKREDVILSKFIKAHRVYEKDGELLFYYLPLLRKETSFINHGRELSKAITTKAWFFDCLALLTNNNENFYGNEQNNKNLDRAVTYIMKNMDKRIKVADVATFSYVSERHLRNLFHKYYNMSVTDFIQNKKVTLAESKLRMGYKVSEAAAVIGIHNASQFSKLFKKITNCSPNDYSNLVKQIR